MTKNSLSALLPTAHSLQFAPLPTPQSALPNTSHSVLYGHPIPPQQRVAGYSFDEWEEFIHEWGHYQKENYQQVIRLTGAGDMGIDIAGLCDNNRLLGVWDNFQCKHYNAPLTPVDAILEIGKILWYSFNRHYVAPRSYFFLAPNGCGTKLSKLLANTPALLTEVITRWDDICAEKITKTQQVALVDEFRKYALEFDYSIFKQRILLEVIDEHRQTPYYTIRFGGGLPSRPPVDPPPAQLEPIESRYTQQLFEAYSDHTQECISCAKDLGSRDKLVAHFHRERENFFHAESLRNFARDNVPPGTYEVLQDEVYDGVVDIEAAEHHDAYARVVAVTQKSTEISISSSPLISALKIKDRKGICHQLANIDRLIWKKS